MRTQAARQPAAEVLPPLSIERVEVFGVAVPLVGPGFKNAYLTKTVQKSALVRITASGGAVGLGNIDPSPGYSTETIEASLSALREELAPLHARPRCGEYPSAAMRASTPRCPDTSTPRRRSRWRASISRRAWQACRSTPTSAAQSKSASSSTPGSASSRPTRQRKRRCTGRSRASAPQRSKSAATSDADRDRVAAIREAVGPEFRATHRRERRLRRRDLNRARAHGRAVQAPALRAAGARSRHRGHGARAPRGECARYPDHGRRVRPRITRASSASSRPTRPTSSKSKS